MTQFGGSLRFVQLPAVTQLLAELGSTGRLCVSHAEWTGEIVVREGQMVEARLGAERGRAALEAIARLIPSLKLVPRLIETPSTDVADTQVTIGAAAVQLIPALVLGHSLAHVASQRGLARTLREVAVLIEGGLVTLEPTSTPAADAAVSEKAAAPLRVPPFAASTTVHRLAPRPRTDVAPAVTPAVMPPRIAARLAAARPNVAPQSEASTASTPARQPAHTQRWRKAITSFFLNDEQPTRP